MFPLNIKPDLNVENSQPQPRIITQDDKEKVVAVTQTIFQVEIKDENWLWHLIFGNLNFATLYLLHKKSMVKGFPLIEKLERVCEGCILGKKHRESFPASMSTRAKKPLNIMNLDLCGPCQKTTSCHSLMITQVKYGSTF